MILNTIQTHSNWIRSKNDLPELKKFEIKCGSEGFEEINNFLHMKFFRFDLDVEFKIREVVGFEFE
jgi:hypothetical protein